MYKKFLQILCVFQWIFMGEIQFFPLMAVSHDDQIRGTIARRPLRVLVIDGGGIRGITPLTWLCDVEAGYNIGDGAAQRPSDPRPPVNLTEEFDVFVGTSTGAIIAAGLAQGMKAQDLLALYMGEERRRIFEASSLIEVN